jgi:chitinase
MGKLTPNYNRWESSADKSSEDGLVRAVVNVLGGPDGKGMDSKPNCLDYPESKYENLRNGFPGE